jgi:plasmid stability protein
MQDEKPNPRDGIKYTVFFDHGTFAELRERAANHNCSVGAELRHIAKNAIAASRTKQQQ